MWAEAMGKLEGMESADRERLWPQLVQGFKDLSQRLKVISVRSLGKKYCSCVQLMAMNDFSNYMHELVT